MQQQMKLSIIMPCFNVAGTIERALDSILIQTVDFQFEIVIVDDASEDDTVGKINLYVDKLPNIRLIRNDFNQGNALSFYKGLCEAQGDYFCVLDGDDYYSISDKLQKQVLFLNQDVKQEYVAVAHYFVIDLCNERYSIPDCGSIDEFNYVDFITQNSGYYHTSTYMYRNIFRGNVPEYFKSFRGDTPRTMFHLLYSNKKVKILNFVGSVYTFSNNGIWSGMKERAQFEYQINYYNNLKKIVYTDFEKKAIDRLLEFNKKKLGSATDLCRKYPQTNIDSILARLGKYTGIYAFAEKEFTLCGLYFSEYVDSLCATLGYIYRLYNKENIQTDAISDHICIVIGALNPQGGGIFREITEIIEMYSDYNVYIIVTNMAAVDDHTIEIFKQYPNLEVICPPPNCGSKLNYLYKAFKDISPSKSYFYTSHNDTYAQALMQPSPCKNICLFSFDHGYICGITNPNLDCIIAKRPSDFGILKNKFEKKVIYIPTWNPGAEGCEGLAYQPFRNHSKLITASGAARFYKVDGGEPYSYIDMVLELLGHTRGVHYHFGPIPNEKMEYVKTYLRDHSLAEEAFVHIEWAENITKEVLTHNIDIFIEPFPVVSYKLTLDMLSCGVPVFAYDGVKRLTKMDFIYPGNMLWKTKSEFITKLLEIESAALSNHSARSIAYFNKTHAINAIKPYFLNEEEFCKPETVCVVDNLMQDVRQYLRLYGEPGKIRIMQKEQEAMRKATPSPCRKLEAREDAEQQIADIKSSWSYRIGYRILWLPRTIKVFIVLSLKKGIGSALRYMKSEDYLSDKGKNPEAVLNRLIKSRTILVGRIATLPFRGLRTMFIKLRNLIHKKKKRDVLLDVKQELENQSARLMLLETLPNIQKRIDVLPGIQKEIEGLSGIQEQVTKQNAALKRLEALSGIQSALEILPGMQDRLVALSGIQTALEILPGMQERLKALSGIQSALEILPGMQEQLGALASIQSALEILPGMQEQLGALASIQRVLEILPGMQERLEALSGIQSALEILPGMQEQLGALASIQRVLEILPGMQERLEALSGIQSALEILPGMQEQLGALASIQSALEILPGMQEQLGALASIQRVLEILPGMREQLEALAGVQRILEALSDIKKALKALPDANKQIATLEAARQNGRMLKEVIWANVYNNTVHNSNWLSDNSFSPGRWAVGYPFLYVLYKALDHMHPRNILELGLGQSTHMISQYAQTQSDVRHVVVEQNQAWVDFCKQTTQFSPRTEIKVLDYAFESYMDADAVRVYSGFLEVVADRQYDIICIDAPSAEGMTQYSRIDILKLIPQNISKTFVIFLDDYHRPGETNTAREIARMLTENHIVFAGGKYGGEKDFYVWCSPDISFLCSM